MKILWLETVAACALIAFMSQGATAGTVDVTSVGTAYSDNGGIVNVNVPGAPAQPWTTPILLQTATGTIAVFCDDLFHTIYVGSSDTFKTGLVTTDSNGVKLSQSQSGTMGLLAQIGLADYRGGNMDGAIAAQAAIWEVEYGTYGSVSINTGYSEYSTKDDTQIGTDFSADMKVRYEGSSWGEELDGSATGVQSQITGVPELSTWGMMLAGFAGLGFAGYRRANSAAMAATPWA
jgi:hypothetical protein